MNTHTYKNTFDFIFFLIVKIIQSILVQLIVKQIWI